MKNFKAYYKLTKPGIIRGNILSIIAGFFIGSGGNLNFAILGFCILGSVLIIGSGCVFNNYIDRDIDKKMARTKNRATVTNQISKKNIFIFGLLLLIIGTIILYAKTNILTMVVGLIGFIFYVFVYAYFKRKNEHGTLVGSISGAVPPLAGYLAIKNELDIGALLVFLILVVWQMPHFYAISIFRRKDYKKASIPVLSITRGVKVTKKYIIAYILLFIFIGLLPTFFGVTGLVFLFVMLLAGVYWLYIGLSNYSNENDVWAKKIFGSSLLVLLAFCFASVVNSVLF